MHSLTSPHTAFVNLPCGYFGMVLGIIGTGFGWRFAATIWPISPLIGDGLVILAILIWVFLSLALLNRLIRYPASVIKEIQDPLLGSFVSLFPATTLLVAIGLVGWCRPLSLTLFTVGAVAQLAYSAWQSAGIWRGNHPHQATTPGLYLPTVANNFISCMACGALGYQDLGLLFLGAGIFSWLSLEPAILQRMRSYGEMPEAVRLSLGIQLAPSLVACSAWLAVNGGEADTFAKLLFGYGLLQLLFMIRLIPWYLKGPFNPGFWSFSFGLSALAMTAIRLGSHYAEGIFDILALPLFIFSNLLVGILIIQTTILIINGKFLKYSTGSLPQDTDKQ